MTPKKVTPCMMPRGLWPLHSLVREALIAHEAAEVAAVRDEAGHPDAQVVVDLEELSLELAQLCGGPLYGCQHDVRVALAMSSGLSAAGSAGAEECYEMQFASCI